MRVRGAVRLVAAAAGLMLVFATLDTDQALARLSALEPAWALAGLAALSVQTAVSARRWRLVAGALGIGLRPGQALREYYQAQFLNQILPGGVLGDVGRAVRSAAPSGLARAGQAVVLERMIGNLTLMAVMMLAVLGAWLLPGRTGLPAPVLHSVALGGAVCLAGIAVIGLAPAWGRLGRIIAGLRDAARRSVLSPPDLRRHLLLSLAAVLANLVAFGCAARATGTDMPVLSGLILIPPILFAMLIPVSVAGWGLREGAAALLFPIAGFSAEAGFAASLAFGLMFLIASLPGLIALLMPDAGNARPYRGVLSRRAAP